MHKSTFARETISGLEICPISLFTPYNTKNIFKRILTRDRARPLLPVLKKLYMDLRKWEYVHTKDIVEMMEICSLLCGDSLEVWLGGEPPIVMSAEVMGPLFGSFKKLREIHFCVCVVRSCEEASRQHMRKIVEYCPKIERICVDDHKERRTAYRYDVFKKDEGVVMELLIEMDKYRA